MADILGQFFKQPPAHSDLIDLRAVVPPPALSVPAVVAPFQPPPALSIPAPVAPFEPPPALSVPSAVSFEPPPVLSVPGTIPFEPPPTLSVPSTLPAMPPPTLRVPNGAAAITPPPLTAPGAVPFEPPPVLGSPADLAAADRKRSILHPDDIVDFAEPRHHQDLAAKAAVPVVSFAEPPHHRDLVASQESAGNHAPGLLSQLESDLLGILTNIDVHNKAFVEVPFVGQLPLDFDLNTHGGKINLGVDLHVAQAARLAEQKALTYAKAKAQALVAAGLTAVIKKFSVQKAVSVGPVAGLGGPLSPVSKAAQTLGPEVPLTFGPTDVPAPVPPQPSQSDPADTYLRDSMLDVSITATLAGLDLDQRMSQAALVASQRGTDRNEVAGGTDASPLLVLFRARETPQNLRLLASLNLASGSNNRLPASFSVPGKQETRGYFKVEASDGTVRGDPLPTDDGAYVPLVFTDLRPIRAFGGTGSKGTYRSVYLRPFIRSLSEGFAPQWSMSPFFGRVDPVATYQGTNRTINLGFTMACFAPEDLAAMYQKLGWLTSMVYPQYQGNVYFRGPVVRMRVGDIINAQGREGLRGVPGVITSLNVSYDGATWELNTDQKLPQSIEITLGFHVLHEFPIGLLAGKGTNRDNQFGGIKSDGADSFGQQASNVNVDRFRAAFGFDYLNDPNTLALTSPSSVGVISPPAIAALPGAI